MKYAYIDNKDKTIIKYREFPLDFDKSKVSHKFGATKELNLLPVETIIEPIDSAIQKQGAIVSEILATKVKQTVKAEPLSEEDLENKRINLLIDEKKPTNPETLLKMMKVIKLLAKDSADQEIIDIVSKF